MPIQNPNVFTLPIILLAASLALGADAPATPPAPPAPLSPQKALEGFQIDPGLRMELVAAEPDVQSPVEIAFDEQGRLWVVEMPDYPNGPAPGAKPAGRIKVLEDSNGDGRYEERAVVFADGLLFANGVLPWKDGALVTAAPEIALLRATDGGRKANEHDRLYEGFTAGNPQLRVSHPTLGLDNWIYVSNGLRGGKAHRVGRPESEAFDLSGLDFRFDLIHDRAEAISGMGQYGLTFDRWGRRFVCDNSHHLRQIVLPNRYLKNNPFLAVPAVIQDVPEAERGQGGAGAKVYPISKTFTTSSLHTGHFTAACSVTIYEGDLLPEVYRGSAFTCEPTGNLVHQEVIQPNGATFRSRPARDGVEFLATTDPWFRPVNLTVGPDGALYVVDMYRAVIEHPEFMPPELKNRPDLNLGKNRGRIWRIVPDGKTERPNRPLLNKASTPDLVAVLGHPNSWQRTTAQRLLLQRQDPKAPPLLREVVRNSDRPLARLQAAWLLEGVKALDDDSLLGLLKDDEAGVREHAVRIAEGRLASSQELRTQVLALGDDPDPRVRFQVALSLGQSKDPDVLTALAKIALAGAGDRWTRLAVASAIPERAGALLTTLLKPPYSLTRQTDADRLALLNELTALVGARRDPGEVADTLDALLSLEGPTAPRWTMAGLQGIAEGMGRRGTQLGAFLDSMTAKATDPAQTRALVDRVNAHLARSAAVALNSDADLSARLDAVRLLAHAPWETAHDALAKLVQEGSTVQELRLAAIRALAAHRRPEVAPLLLERWQAYTPAVRHEAADALLRQPDRVQVLLTELEAGRVRPGDLDTAQTRRLLATGSAENKARAKTLLQAAQPEERRQVLDRYQAALTRPGDLHRGLDVFRKSCATCHRVAGVGVDVGPDIGDTRTKTRAALLENILSPNSAIDGNYVGYVVVLKDGGVLEGVLSAETASSISLRRAEGKTDVVLRSDIEELRSTGLSLMPEGLEREIDVPAMADLLEFLKSWRYLDDAKPSGE